MDFFNVFTKVGSMLSLLGVIVGLVAYIVKRLTNSDSPLLSQLNSRASERFVNRVMVFAMTAFILGLIVFFFSLLLDKSDKFIDKVEEVTYEKDKFTIIFKNESGKNIEYTEKSTGMYREEDGKFNFFELEYDGSLGDTVDVVGFVCVENTKDCISESTSNSVSIVKGVNKNISFQFDKDSLENKRNEKKKVFLELFYIKNNGADSLTKVII